MKLRRRMLARVAVITLLVGSSVAVFSGPAHAALTNRNCRTILTGDGVRRLDFCARGWVNDSLTSTRGVVEMHTYAYSGGRWVDSRSQSMTMNAATLYNDATGGYVDWGQDISRNCRINGPSGTVGCSVPNVIRIAYYGPARSAPGHDPWRTTVYKVSWRDDRGVPHYVSSPTGDPILTSPTWDA
jgi:hypothetical protein